MKFCQICSICFGQFGLWCNLKNLPYFYRPYFYGQRSVKLSSNVLKSKCKNCMIKNKNNLQCWCVWWFVRSFISNSQSIFFISTSRLLQRILWHNSSEIYWKKVLVFPSVLLLTNPLPSPPLPSFFATVNESSIGRQLSSWQLCLSFILHKHFSGENRPRWPLGIQTSILALE